MKLRHHAGIFPHVLGAAAYVKKILDGEKLGEILVQQPKKFELIVNLVTAKGLGLNLAESFLVHAALRPRASTAAMGIARFWSRRKRSA